VLLVKHHYPDIQYNFMVNGVLEKATNGSSQADSSFSGLLTGLFLFFLCPSLHSVIIDLAGHPKS
jgi:hypothetical protein